MSEPSTRIPFMGELKQNSGTFYQFSNFANSYIDGKITPLYYIALDLDIKGAQTANLVKNGVTISGEHPFDSPNITQKTNSINSHLSEVLMKYYEAKIGTIQVCDNGKSNKYFESYLLDAILNYLDPKDHTITTYLDTEINRPDEPTNGTLTIDGVAYPFDSDADRALIKIQNTPIRYIGRINCQGLHEFMNRAYADLHINIPSAHNVLGNVLPVKISDEVELNRKKMADVTCKCEIITEVPYITATGHADDTDVIRDVNEGYFYYKNLDIVEKCSKYTDDDARQQKLLIENNLRIDYEELIKNYSSFSQTHDEPTTVEFNTIVIMGRDEVGCVVPCGVFFSSHYTSTDELVSQSTKIDPSIDSDNGAEYSLRLSTGVQVMQNVTEVYEQTDSNSTTNDIGELTSIVARLSALGDALRDDLQLSGKWSGQLSTLIGNAYTIRRNVPYLVDWNKGTEKVKVWYVNGMNTGVCADGSLLSNTTQNSQIEKDIEKTSQSTDPMKPKRFGKDDLQVHVESVSVSIDGTEAIKVSNIYLPNDECMNENSNLFVTEGMKYDGYDPRMANAMPWVICQIMDEHKDDYIGIEEDEFFSIYYKLNDMIYHTTISMNKDGFYPVMDHVDYDEEIAERIVIV